MSNSLAPLANKLADRFGMASPDAVLVTLKATAFKGNVSDPQMAALLIVADQYGLNPFTKEIYAFPDKNNGIVPVVGVDGWSRIINSHPQFDGMDFEQDDESCTCRIYRKDRSHPIAVTEWMSECKRANVGPWQSHPKRMLRHKAMIQCARIAFGFAGIYDQDEAERIVERDMGAAVVDRPTVDLPAIMLEIDQQTEVVVLRDKLRGWLKQCAEAKDEASGDAIKAAATAKATELKAAEEQEAGRG